MNQTIDELESERDRLRVALGFRHDTTRGGVIDLTHAGPALILLVTAVIFLYLGAR